LRSILPVLLLTAIVSTVSAVSWSGSVSNVTDGSYWEINRQSGNLSFDLSGSVEGEVSPIEVTPSGRILSAYNSRYTDIKANDVRLHERTSALEGIYSSDEEVCLRAEAYDDVKMNITKPAGSDVWIVSWSERWPVTLNASRSINYKGRGINDRDCAGNNLNGVSNGFLYSQEFSMDRATSLRLDRMNATVKATNDTILQGDFMPTMSLDYMIESHSTGIADLGYRQIDTSRSVVNYDEERYYGTYDISRAIGMRSNFTDDWNWLSCFGGCADIDPEYLATWGESDVFDCV
jgi:hypothetical protein